ncbi:hypothetical protein [Fuerstiella marisgermanici]|uniref:Uncharacterized protein n=1 Tax=Fuerstiella marisgermanici TaxID=1891926 RepID=A0A1P8WGN6_9PLAN|nr:hypothetical protein [Fuerstiella marisgermanici]APZ93236.1 hypothetical protein Fuma_02853 [Fuerstiella marisgermanici]
MTFTTHKRHVRTSVKVRRVRRIDTSADLFSTFVGQPMAKLVPKIVELAASMTQQQWTVLTRQAKQAAESDCSVRATYAMIQQVGVLTGRC